ncbi:MAG: hypothetical protein E7Z73_09410 [Methanobrevibacter millerae]|uniref:Uncharacterized protein n=1 Tax=Methanobrevibacter millerae TaxID=230361 RepID=A0A8T3VMP7_9EURY|nr:hypothetical protein [Methanobrevibacter millerae]MBE6505930.1 hypothetical protein [Methanobrevibacter millerae]
MNYIILTLLFILSGFFMKYSDDLYDVNHERNISTFLGLICGLASVAATLYNVDAAYIFISLLIGNIIVFKVDGIHHIVALIVFLAVLLIVGIPNLSLLILLICILGIIGDEIGHELIPNMTENRFLNFFFEYRFVMKIVVLLLALCGVFNIWIFVCFILFEVSYVGAGIVFEIYN